MRIRIFHYKEILRKVFERGATKVVLGSNTRFHTSRILSVEHGEKRLDVERIEGDRSILLVFRMRNLLVQQLSFQRLKDDKKQTYIEEVILPPHVSLDARGRVGQSVTEGYVSRI